MWRRFPPKNVGWDSSSSSVMRVMAPWNRSNIYLSFLMRIKAYKKIMNVISWYIHTKKIMSFRLGLIFLKYSIAVPLQLCYMFHKIIIWRRKSWNKCLNQNSTQIVKDALLLPANFLFSKPSVMHLPKGIHILL